MKEDLFQFIKDNNLSPFNKNKTQVKSNKVSIFKTKDSKQIYTKTLSKISSNFVFSETSNLLNFFNFTNNSEEILKRQEFFKNIKSLGKINSGFLKEINSPKSFWKPEYDVVVVTENTDTFTQLKEKNCPVQLLVSETDVSLLEDRDVVQVIDCDEFGLILESLPQSVFLNSIEEVYLERYLEKFSGWVENIKILNDNFSGKELKEIISELFPLIKLTNKEELKIFDKESIENDLEKINEKVYSKLKEITISGESLVSMLSKGILPENIKSLLKEEINKKELPIQILNIGLPLTIDEEELDKLIRQQSSNEFSNLAETIKSHSNELKKIPPRLERMSVLLLYFDFISGVSRFIDEEMIFPLISEELIIDNSKNIFLENPKPISFNLSKEYLCSILTGANSGGKTTLIEHILGLISLFNLGLPVYGKIELPIFEEIYYFAKNKGSNLKGAFETLLSQMSEIKPGHKTLILADEIEAVTEPGVAGNIIAATCEYYINKNCFLIVATHLGREIQNILPKRSRIDGIEAKGLTENFELIVEHNPVLGRLAHSTPELIVEKMANLEKKDYFIYLNEYLKNK